MEGISSDRCQAIGEPDLSNIGAACKCIITYALYTFGDMDAVFSHWAQYQRFLVFRVKNAVYTAKAAIVFRYGDFGEICELTEPDCAHMEPEKINVRQTGRDMNMSKRNAAA